MTFTRCAILALAFVSVSSAQNLDTSSSDALKKSAGQVAANIKGLYKDPTSAILPLEDWEWWESGSTCEGLINYYHITGDDQYNTLVANTIVAQATGSNDFMTSEATGNDDQAWWALAAMAAAENKIPSPSGAPTWDTLAKNVFTEQNKRWDTTTCGGGMKWKIQPNADGYDYKSTIGNGLYFQLAARLAKFSKDSDILAAAVQVYNWTSTIGLIDGDFNVYDGSGDQDGCKSINHDQWSYNTAVFLYGTAVMYSVTGDAVWANRTQGFVNAAKTNFVKNGNLFESKCESDDITASSCNVDQQSFKATLARWMGNAAPLVPASASAIQDIMSSAATAVGKAYATSWTPGEQLGALETLDAALATSSTKSQRRTPPSIAGRIQLDPLF